MAETNYNHRKIPKPPNKDGTSSIPDTEVTAVVSGKRVKKGFGEELAKVGRYLITDTIIPNGKHLFSEFVSRGLNMLLFKNDSGVNDPYGGYGSNLYTNYNKSYGSPSFTSLTSAIAGLPGIPQQQLNAGGIDNLVVRSYSEGQKVIKRINELVSSYGTISVYEVCKLINVTGKYTDYDWGWTDVRGATVVPYRGQYILKMPPPVSLR